MIAYLYCWRIKEGLEQQFIENWTAVTGYHREHSGSLGSRLHRGDDGLFYAYACWPSAEVREAAFANPVALPERDLMNEAVAERLPETKLEVCEDLLIR